MWASRLCYKYKTRSKPTDFMTKCKMVMTEDIANDGEVIVMQLDLGETMMIMMMIIDF